MRRLHHQQQRAIGHQRSDVVRDPLVVLNWNLVLWRAAFELVVFAKKHGVDSFAAGAAAVPQAVLETAANAGVVPGYPKPVGVQITVWQHNGDGGIVGSAGVKQLLVVERVLAPNDNSVVDDVTVCLQPVKHQTLVARGPQ